MSSWFHLLPELLLLGLTRGAMYALIALGYTLVYGVLQLINFAHSEVFMAGSFGSYLVIHKLVGDTGNPNGLVVALIIILGLFVGALTGAAVAWMLERVAYRTCENAAHPNSPS